VGLPDCRAVLFLSVLFLFSTIAAAQAWVPEKGEGTATLTLQDNFVKDHLGSGGQRFDVGHIRTFIAFQDIDYGITDKLALDVSVPFVLSKYYGPKPHQLPVDDGKYHGNFQDVRLNLRYNLRAHRHYSLSGTRYTEQRLHILCAFRCGYQPARVRLRLELWTQPRACSFPGICASALCVSYSGENQGYSDVS